MTIQSSALVEGLTQRLAREHLIGREPSTIDRVRSVLAEELGHDAVGLKLIDDKIIKGVHPDALPPEAAPKVPEVVVVGPEAQRPLDRPHSHEAFAGQTAREYAQHQAGKGRGPIPVEHIANVEVDDGENTSVFKIGDEVVHSHEGVDAFEAAVHHQCNGRITSFEKGPDGGLFAHLDFSPSCVPVHELTHPSPSNASGESQTESASDGASEEGPSDSGPSSSADGQQSTAPGASSSSDSLTASGLTQQVTSDDSSGQADAIQAAEDSAGSSPSSTTELQEGTAAARDTADPDPAATDSTAGQPSNAEEANDAA